jgi:hypothetical protein
MKSKKFREPRKIIPKLFVLAANVSNKFLEVLKLFLGDILDKVRHSLSLHSER